MVGLPVMSEWLMFAVVLLMYSIIVGHDRSVRSVTRGCSKLETWSLKINQLVGHCLS